MNHLVITNDPSLFDPASRLDAVLSRRGRRSAIRRIAQPASPSLK